MTRIIRTANDDQRLDYHNRHRTWITVNGHTYESRLLNQYDLAEAVEYSRSPLLIAERRTKYMRWLASHIRNEDSIIYYELCLLADAADAGLDIKITVHADSTHGEIIQQAIEWMQRHTQPVDDGRRPVRPDRSSAPVLLPEFMLCDAEEELDPDRIVWVMGKTVTHMAYLADREGIVTAAVPGYGLIKVGRFDGYRPAAWPAYIRPCPLCPDAAWENAVLRIVASLENRPTYNRWDPWDLAPDSTNRGPEAAYPMLPRPYRLKPRPFADPGIIRPVWRWNSRTPRTPRLRILDPDKQAQGKVYFYRPATPQEYQAWRSR